MEVLSREVQLRMKYVYIEIVNEQRLYLFFFLRNAKLYLMEVYHFFIAYRLSPKITVRRCGITDWMH